MSNAKNTAVKQQVEDETARIRAVRDLIFGDEMAEYQKEFGRIKEMINQHQATARDQLKNESSGLNEKIDALEHGFDQSLKQLRKEMHEGLDKLEGLHNAMLENRHEVGKALAQIAEFMQE